MEQATGMPGRRAGWSEAETRLLWETAGEALKSSVPLKQVFEQIAQRTGRRPNSIRNYYYAQSQKRDDAPNRPQRFVPFAETEVTSLVETVLRAKAAGQSVRACLTELAGGDHRAMLRYQNKYRSVLKSRPALLRDAVAKLSAEGVVCGMPSVKTRGKANVEEAAQRMTSAARASGDPEIAQMCDTLARLISSPPAPNADALRVRVDLMRIAADEREKQLAKVREAGEALTSALKEWIALPGEARANRSAEAAAAFSECLGAFESALTPC